MTEDTAAPGEALPRRPGIAVWRLLETRLADDIREGRIAADGRLPTEARLAARFGVNRHTVRRAIGSLADQGLVRVEQGRGMFAQEVVIDYPLKERTSFSANLLAQGREPSHDLPETELVEADAAVAAALGLRSGAEIVRSRSIGYADEVPISLGVSHFPTRRFPGLAERLRADGRISEVLKTFGIEDYRRRSTRILTRLPTPEEAAALKQPTAQPVLVTEAIDVDLDGRPIRFGTTCFAGGRVQITVGEG
jgi:GntR family phosphonate transport system transcriptional regulator